MKEMQVALKRIMIILSTIMILFAIIFFFAKQNTILENEKNGNVNELLNLAVSNIGDSIFKKNLSFEAVNWWYNEEDTRYYLFLPSCANPDKLRLQLTGVGSINLDGKKIYNYDICSISLNEQHVITSDDSDSYYVLMAVKSENVPAIFINTESREMDFVNEVKGNEESGEMLIVSENGELEYNGPLAGIRGRGNASWYACEQKGYQLSMPFKRDIFGMGVAKNWILIANAADGTKLRNYIAYELARDSGLRYTPEACFVDCYFNGYYNGSYLLSEKIEIAPERIEIPDLQKKTQDINPEKKLKNYTKFGDPGSNEINSSMGYEIPNNPSDITGGYLLEIEMIDRKHMETSGFITSHNQPIIIKSPAEPSREEVSYIQEFYQKMENAVFSEDGINHQTNRRYDDYIDTDSYVKKYLLEEIVKNPDAMNTSSFFYKYPDYVSDKLYAGPVWDYDGALGNEQSDIDTSPDELYVMKNINGHNIWHELYNKPDFYKNILRRYHMTMRPIIMDIVQNRLRAKAQEISESVVMTQLRWYDGYEDMEGFRKWYVNEIGYLEKFIIERIKFLDTQWVN